MNESARRVAARWISASVQISDKTLTKRYQSPHHDPQAVARVEAVLARIPTKFTSGLREIVIFPPERGSFYVGTGADGEYQSNTRTVMVSAEPRLDSIEGILAHEIGHHVADHLLSTEQRIHLQQALGARTEDWNEDFASCFGFFYSGRQAQARRYETSFQVLMSL